MFKYLWQISLALLIIVLFTDMVFVVMLASNIYNFGAGYTEFRNIQLAGFHVAFYLTIAEARYFDLNQTATIIAAVMVAAQLPFYLLGVMGRK